MQSLTCVGSWTSDEDDKVSYLVGILDVPFVHKITDKLRCFVYRQTPHGYRVGQSSDASCHDLNNPRTDGFRLMHLKKGEPLLLLSSSIVDKS